MLFHFVVGRLSRIIDPIMAAESGSAASLLGRLTPLDTQSDRDQVLSNPRHIAVIKSVTICSLPKRSLTKKYRLPNYIKLNPALCCLNTACFDVGSWAGIKI